MSCQVRGLTQLLRDQRLNAAAPGPDDLTTALTLSDKQLASFRAEEAFKTLEQAGDRGDIHRSFVVTYIQNSEETQDIFASLYVSRDVSVEVVSVTKW